MGLNSGDIRRLASFISVALFLVVLMLTWPSGRSGSVLAAAGINQELSFTGKLVNKTSGTNITDGTYNMEFNIYQDGNSSGSGGTLKWTEDYLVSGSTGMPTTGGVTVTSGTFQVNLGSICALSGGTCGNKTNAGVSFNQNTLWLSIDLGNTSACTVTSSTSSFDTTGAGNCNGDTQMTPYVQLTAVPYALNTLNFGTMSVSGSTYTTSAGASFATTGANGFSFKPGTDTNGAFQITNASGTSIANFDTSSPTANNLVSNPSFESAVSGWSATGSASAPAQSSAQAYEGSNSLKIATTGSNGGASYTTGASFLTQNSNYALSFFAKTDSTQSVATFEAGYSYNAGTNFVSCLTGQTLTTGWRQFRCSFIETSATSGNPFIYFRQTDAVTRNIYIDDVVLQLDANATNDYHNATLDLTGTNIQSPLILKDTTNETTAFQIQNPSGVQIFNVDTTDTNLVTNPGFEVNTSSWALINGATNLYRDTTRSYSGVASGRFTTTSTTSSGIRYTFPSQLTSGNYVISFYAMTSAADSTLSADFNNGSSDAACTGLTPAASATVPSTTGWTRFYCTVSSSAIAQYSLLLGLRL